MGLETIELSEQAILVHLHAISSRSPCPQCGTPGSRIHGRYQRTIADVAFGARHLILKLVVRKWICREASCSQRIFAERFPGLVQRYARMTDRLVEALQSVGVTTNGADAARILSTLGMPMGKQAFPCSNGVYSFTQHRKGHPIRTSWERRLENGQPKGKRMMREDAIYEGRTLQIIWSAEPPPPPRALVTQVNGLPYLPSRPSRR